MLDKLDIVRQARQSIADLETAIEEEDKKLQDAYKELTRLRDYKVLHVNCKFPAIFSTTQDKVQHERKNYIAGMKETMTSWKKFEEDIEGMYHYFWVT